MKGQNTIPKDVFDHEKYQQLVERIREFIGELERDEEKMILHNDAEDVLYLVQTKLNDILRSVDK